MAQFAGVQWNLRPDYVALTQRDDPAGIVTAYSRSRRANQIDCLGDELQLLTISKIPLVQAFRLPMSRPSFSGEQVFRQILDTVADHLL